MSSHAKLFSPSKADGWFECPGRAVMEAGFPDVSSDSAANGTARHAVCAHVLREWLAGLTPTPLRNLAGFYVRPDGTVFMPNVDDDLVGCIQYEEDWADEDQSYVDAVRDIAGSDGEVYVEQSVDFRRFLECNDPDDGFGTADTIVLKPLADSTYELVLMDRKTGYHEVPVEQNKQLLLYALGAYDEHSLVYDISRVRLIIHQRAAREWDCSVEDLLAFAAEARSRAITVTNAVAMHGKVDQVEWEATFLNQQPSESACKFCRAMATCPSMHRHVQDVVGQDFKNLTPTYAATEHTHPDLLADVMNAAGLIEDFLKSVRAETERRLLAGVEVPGFKLVLGKQGNRKWVDDKAAEDLLRKTFRLPVEKAYDLSVISPTTAEKLVKAGDIGPKQWAKAKGLITRSEPKPSVAPVSDKRDAWVPPNVADDFQEVADADDFQEVADAADLA